MIRALRKKRGWTQAEFAEKCGLHHNHLGEIERGESNATLLTLKTLADALHVRVRDLVRDL